MITMIGEAKISVLAPGNPCAPAVWVVGVAGNDIGIVAHFPDAAQVVSCEVIVIKHRLKRVRPTDSVCVIVPKWIIPLFVEMSAYTQGKIGAFPPDTDLSPTPDETVFAGNSSRILFYNFNPPAKPIIRELGPMGALVD
jgi:hypothetical protein